MADAGVTQRLLGHSSHTSVTMRHIATRREQSAGGGSVRSKRWSCAPEAQPRL